MWVSEWMNRRRQWHPTPVLLPGKSHGRRSLVGCSPWGRRESDTTEWLHFHFSLSCIGEGNGNPLQCSCLENPTDGGAWWAAVSGVAQSRTWLKWLSSTLFSVFFFLHPNSVSSEFFFPMDYVSFWPWWLYYSRDPNLFWPLNPFGKLKLLELNPYLKSKKISSNNIYLSKYFLKTVLWLYMCRFVNILSI